MGVGVVARLGLRPSLCPYVLVKRGQAWLDPPTDVVLASVWVGPLDTCLIRDAFACSGVRLGPPSLPQVVTTRSDTGRKGG